MGEVRQMNTPLIEIAAAGAAPRTVDGTALDHNCLHCQLSLPIQHFIERHPEKTRDQLIREVCEVIAELVGSSTPNWNDARKLAKFATEQVNDQVYAKFKAFERLRNTAPARGD
jgi:hypothetical protein